MRMIASVLGTLLFSQLSFAHVVIDPITGHVSVGGVEVGVHPVPDETGPTTEPGTGIAGDLGTAATALQHGRVYSIVNAFSGKCLDVPGNSFVPGTALQQWDCHGGSNQKFRVIDVYNIVGHPAWILEAVGTGQRLMISQALMSNGAPLVQTYETFGNAEYFHIKPTAQHGMWTMVTGQAGKCLDIANLSSENGARIHQWQCHDRLLNQYWVFIPG